MLLQFTLPLPYLYVTFNSFIKEEEEAAAAEEEEEDEEDEDRLSPQLSVKHSQELSDKLQLSGLSGVSDIVGEYIRKGDIVPEDVGLTEKEGQELAATAR